ncbi:MAG: LysR family transcriptional regulator [Acidimicrobiales bacterium]
MDIRQLGALVAVADAGSFSGAANLLDTVQSNVSAHVKKLENTLNVTLVDRASCTLTSAGEIVVARARRAQRELDALRADVLALQHEVAGTVRIGIIGTTARWLVPQLLDVSPLRFPELRLVFVESTTTALEAQLATGQVDVAVLNLHSSHDMLLTPLFEEELVLVTSRDHPLARRGEISVAELDELPILLPRRGTAFRRELDERVASVGVHLQPKAEVDGTRLIATLTFEGYGPAILPATAVPRYLMDRWSIIHVKEIPKRLVGVAQRPQTLPSAPVRAVLDMLTEIVFNAASLPPGLTAVPPDRVRPSVPPRQSPL